jgi:hypothetical protein
MRTVRQPRCSGSSQRRRWTALAVALVAVLAVAIGVGVSGSGEAHHAPGALSRNTTARTAADTQMTYAYSGGRSMAADPTGGYWTVNWVGVITAYRGAPTFGSPALSGVKLSKPIVGMAATPDGQGYWLVASDGGIFTYGDAAFYGSTGDIHLNQPIVGMAATPDGQGYWLVASDGGIFTYGDAAFYGSLGGGSSRVLGIIVSPPLAGYGLVATNGSANTFSSPVAGADESASAPTPTAIPDASQGSDCQPTATTPTATVNSSLDSLMANQVGPGWIGGDATYSTALPGGGEAFDFSDSLIGTAAESGSANVTGLIHNSELVGSMSDLQSDIAGTVPSPQTLIPDTTDSGDQWQVAATFVEGGNQLVFVNEFAPVQGSAFDRYTGRSGIAVLRIPSGGVPTFSSVTLLPTDPSTQWGNAVTQSGGYSYVYGTDSDTTTGAFYGMKLARVAEGESLNSNEWQYWNGSQWASGESNAVNITTTNELTGVTTQANAGGFVGVSIPGSVYTDKTVDLSYACSPTGPWSTPTPVYTIPQVSQYNNEIAYIPTFHPELSSPGDLVVSYNIDTTDGLAATEADVHQYQPQFLQVSPG